MIMHGDEYKLNYSHYRIGLSRAVIIRIAENSLKNSKLDIIWVANKDKIQEEKIDAIISEVSSA